MRVEIKVAKKNDLKAKFTLFCDYALVSQDNKLSIIGEFDHIFSVNEKAALNKGFLVSQLLSDPNKKINLELSINNADKTDEIFKKSFEITTDPAGRAGLMVEFGNLVFNKFGIYKAKISSNGEEVSAVNLDVVKVKAPEVARA